MIKIVGILILVIIISSFVHAKDNLGTPGIGVGDLLIKHQFPPDSDRQQYAAEGIFLSGSGGIIKSIFITSPIFKTKDGIKVGDKIQKIIQVFGIGKRVELPLLKGNVRIGNMGKAISFDGIIFIINNKYVTGIIIKEI